MKCHMSTPFKPLWGCSLIKWARKRTDLGTIDCAFRELLEETGIRRDQVTLRSGLRAFLSEGLLSRKGSKKP